MEKIQQLLNEHKDKLWDGEPLETILTIDGILIIETDSGCINSLSDLLFNTPFLSWLEWNGPELGTDWIHFIDGDYSTEPKQSDYHKINLVLLSTDEERIIYLESNLL